MLKNQIMAFNKLLADQFQLMNKDYSSGVTSMPITNGSNSTSCKTILFFPSLVVVGIPNIRDRFIASEFIDNF